MAQAISQAVVYGRRFDTVAFDNYDECNEFLEADESYGVLTTDLNNVVHVAMMNDTGIPI